jgi:hypothetical protein
LFNSAAGLESNANNAKGSSVMIKTILIASGAAYLISWIIHGKLIKRIQNTCYYLKRGHYSYRQAWRIAGRTI